MDDPEDFRIQPCFSPVWDTAINIIALGESGVPADHPALRKAASWLVGKEVTIPWRLGREQSASEGERLGI